MAPSSGPDSSVTPVRATASEGGNSTLYPAYRFGKDGRSYSNSSAVRGASPATIGPGPGSFSTELKSTISSRSITPRPDFMAPVAVEEDGEDYITTSERKQEEIRDLIAKELKIKTGSENMLEALQSKNPKQTREQRLRVDSELNSSNRKIAELRSQLEEEIQRSKVPSTPPRNRLTGLFRGSPLREPSRNDDANEIALDGENPSESPTYVLEETLQALEAEGMQPDYYVERANNLVELFKRHPTLKYDLVWSVFGLRVQTMLLNDSKEVAAAGYRLTRYAIADIKSLRVIRSLHTDEIVILSLVKDSKAAMEREQALKFVRAFLEVKDGVREISKGILRTIIAIAEHHEDRLRPMCILTLSEIFVKHPQSVVSAGGMGPLNDALSDGTYQGAESLAGIFLYIMDTPSRRKYLESGHELEAVFAPFTDALVMHSHEERLRSNAKAIAAILKTWPGLISLASNRFSAIRSLLQSLSYPSLHAQDLILELLFDILRIKPPSWSSSFLAGRRLTTYGRVAQFKADRPRAPSVSDAGADNSKIDLTAHFTALILAILLKSGLVEALRDLIESAEDAAHRRKATLLLTEALKLASQTLPTALSSKIQVLPELFQTAFELESPNWSLAGITVYQIDSISRTLRRTNNSSGTYGESFKSTNFEDSLNPAAVDVAKSKLGPTMDETQFRTLILESQVLNTVNYLKWKWDLIHGLIEGPLTNPKRLEEAMKATKFIKRLVGFYRPFKYRFSEIRNTKPNQRYVRTGCALMRTLMTNPEGVRYLMDNKLVRQLAECLAQLDRMSGLTSASPIFSPERMSETLTGGYFTIIGVLSSDSNGLAIFEKWHMINMFYHIIELSARDDLIQALLGNMDFSIDGHLRVMLSKALTACSKENRIYSTRLLRKYVVRDPRAQEPFTGDVANVQWALSLLVTQLYDPEVEVCEVAVKILEEACNEKSHLEYVVRCRPALDHLGEIGAPLLLRFLSTSVGYHYLAGLDYITQEMDDWFLGRNDTYVTLVEASIARAYTDRPSRSRFSLEEVTDVQGQGTVPPHFYRELTRTTEGCKLLQDSGHFYEFASIIRDYEMSDEDPEMVMKVKGCLWAVGNVGSMDLGATFLEETDVVQWMVKIARESTIMSLKGTAFFTLGLISRSLHGLEMLAECGWDTPTDGMGRSLGLCIPSNLEEFLSIQSWKTSSHRQTVEYISAERVKEALCDNDPVVLKILGWVVDLGNAVLTKKAASDIHAVKTRRPELFQRRNLFEKVLLILENQHMRLPVRRFLVNSFDHKNLIRRMVFEDDSDSEDELN
ncbi:MAG: hypothetical protein M1834_003953 [Cirrosporium novae-zelandiae]|nr:MAG: hypothetical protein M1834_003953 [Cirrosporium novae-zelandiae]